MFEENEQILPQNVEELQKQVVKAQSLLSEKDLENTALREQIRQFEIRWLEHESKMKAIEDTWQSQMSSLQVSFTCVIMFLHILYIRISLICIILFMQINLAAAKKTLGSHMQTGKPDDSISPNYYDSEDTISGIQTPPQMTPVRIGNSRHDSRGVIADTIDFLSKEFEQRTHNFDHDAKVVVRKEIEDYNNLKRKFEMWKKEYRNRLREVKTRLVKGVHTGGGGVGDKQTRNWWGKLSKKGKERVV